MLSNKHFNSFFLLFLFEFVLIFTSAAQNNLLTEKLNQEAHRLRYTEPEKSLFLSKKVQKICQQDTLSSAFLFSLRNAGMAYLNLYKYDSARYELERGILLAEKAGNLIELSACHNNLGLVCKTQGQISDARKHFAASIDIDTRLQDREGMAIGLNNLGELYLLEGNTEMALTCFKRTLQIEQETGNIIGSADALNNIGSVYYDSGNFLKSIEYFNKALQIYEKHEALYDAAMTLNNIGSALSLLKQFDEAMLYIQKSIAIREKSNDKLGLANSYLKMGEVYNQMGNFILSEDWFFKGMELALEIGDFKQLANGFNHRGLNLLEQGDTANAIQYLQNSLEFAKEIQFNKLLLQLFDTLSVLSAATNDYKSAFTYLSEKNKLLQNTSTIADLQSGHKQTKTSEPKSATDNNSPHQVTTIILTIAGLFCLYLLYIIKRLKKRIHSLKSKTV